MAKPRGLIEMCLALNSKDGSLREETTVFSQRGVFRLERYQLVQHGPSFPTTKVSIDRKTAQYKAGDEGQGGKAVDRYLVKLELAGLPAVAPLIGTEPPENEVLDGGRRRPGVRQVRGPDVPERADLALGADVAPVQPVAENLIR